MASHKDYTHNNVSTHRGFTLIEVLIVISIFIAITSVGAIFNLTDYQKSNFRAERDTLVSILERARSEAMANMESSPWGVCFVDPNYIIFKGTSCSGGESTPANMNIASSSDLSAFPIVFEQLTGNLIPPLYPSSQEATIIIRQENEIATISINNEGRISW